MGRFAEGPFLLILNIRTSKICSFSLSQKNSTSLTKIVLGLVTNICIIPTHFCVQFIFYSAIFFLGRTSVLQRSNVNIEKSLSPKLRIRCKNWKIFRFCPPRLMLLLTYYAVQYFETSCTLISWIFQTAGLNLAFQLFKLKSKSGTVHWFMIGWYGDGDKVRGGKAFQF